jgi:1,4-alpha-glucan branching enzyme
MALKKAYVKTGSTCRVTFTLPVEESKGATEARLCGDFNNWDEQAAGSKMALKDGVFSKTLTLDKGREYQFRYLLDGLRWENDWHADKYIQSPTNAAEDNSVVVV